VLTPLLFFIKWLYPGKLLNTGRKEANSVEGLVIQVYITRNHWGDCTCRALLPVRVIGQLNTSKRIDACKGVSILFIVFNTDITFKG
jgi:hypothetical protein